MDAREPGDANLFGPSAEQLRELADHAVDRTVGAVERKVVATAKAYAAKAALYGVVGCVATGGACGCVLGVLLGLLKLVGYALEAKRARSRASRPVDITGGDAG